MTPHTCTQNNTLEVVSKLCFLHGRTNTITHSVILLILILNLESIELRIQLSSIVSPVAEGLTVSEALHL